ncbi:hypothetical protein Plhal304r1_c010g0039571 [Plasmopara halstedii]
MGRRRRGAPGARREPGGGISANHFDEVQKQQQQSTARRAALMHSHPHLFLDPRVEYGFCWRIPLQAMDVITRSTWSGPPLHQLGLTKTSLSSLHSTS